MLAPFMIVIIYFAAFQATRAWEDLITLFVLGILGMYMKRFGWSRPALLIGFVLSMRLDASVYQSIQVYGMSFLERGGVQVMLALIAVSVFLAARMKPHREPLTEEGPYAPVNKTPQAIFLGAARRRALRRSTTRGSCVPGQGLSDVGCADHAGAARRHRAAFCRPAPSYVFFDSEREWRR